jgi:hypothetical protein
VLLSDFVTDEETGIALPPQEAPPAGYLDGAERYLFERLPGVADRSVGSEELQTLSARLSAASWEILLSRSGWIASLSMALKVGAIANSVRNSEIPTSTWFGGAVGVPRPERMKPRTIRMRVKPVTVNSSAGQRDAADQQQQLDGVGAVGLHLITVLARRSSSERRSAWPRLGHAAGTPGREGAAFGPFGVVSSSSSSPISPSARASFSP